MVPYGTVTRERQGAGAASVRLKEQPSTKEQRDRPVPATLAPAQRRSALEDGGGRDGRAVLLDGGERQYAGRGERAEGSEAGSAEQAQPRALRTFRHAGRRQDKPRRERAAPPAQFARSRTLRMLRLCFTLHRHSTRRSGSHTRSTRRSNARMLLRRVLTSS